MKLEQIADIHIGTIFRSRLMTSAKGRIKVIQMRNLTAGNRIDIKGAACIEGDGDLKAHHELRVGDILFRSRGLRTTAKLLTEETDLTIVSAPIFVIRVKTERARPSYLVWWINQPSSQAYLHARSEGSSVKMISKQTLANLPVAIPSVEKQECIADYYELTMQEQVLLNKIRIKRKRYAHEIMREMASSFSDNYDFTSINNEIIHPTQEY